VILAIARKCKHCGEFLDRAQPPAAGAPGAQTADPAAQAAAADVAPVYAVSVSQWDNFWKYLILLFLVGMIGATLVFVKPLKDYAPVGIMGTVVIAGFFGWFFYLAAKNTKVYVRPLRVDTETGILSKDLDSLDYFRINDMELKQSLIERLLGIGTIRLMTNDSTSEPELVLYQIPRAREIYKYIQNQIPLAAKQRGAVYMEK
jgi:uncharacterized membrane protein YdbT with pleckstrin-like domain